MIIVHIQFSLVIPHGRLFVTHCTIVLSDFWPITNSWSLPKLISIESDMPSYHLILCLSPLLLPSIFPITRVFSKESVFCIRWQSISVLASVSILSMNIQD